LSNRCATARLLLREKVPLVVVQKGPKRSQPMTAEGLRGLLSYRRRERELTQANAHRFRIPSEPICPSAFASRCCSA